MKGLVHVPPLPAILEELRQRMTTTLQTVAQDTQQRVWEELDYRIDVSRVSWERTLSIFEIHIYMNFSLKFGGIILILFNIKHVQFHLP